MERERGRRPQASLKGHGRRPPRRCSRPPLADPYPSQEDVLRSKGLNTIDDLEGPEPTTGAPAQAAATTRSSGGGPQAAQYDLDGARETDAEAEEAALAGG